MVTTTGQNGAPKQAAKKRTRPFLAAESLADDEPRFPGRSSTGGRKKLTPFNKFMQTETARLKEEQPDLDNKERYAPLICRGGRPR